jgi:hypothetical protein
MLMAGKIRECDQGRKAKAAVMMSAQAVAFFDFL